MQNINLILFLILSTEFIQFKHIASFRIKTVLLFCLTSSEHALIQRMLLNV